MCPADLDIHLVVDNVSTHKAPEIRKWLLRHLRFQLDFIPTYSSWLNLVEPWFAELTKKWLRSGTHRSTKDLEARHHHLDRALERGVHPVSDYPIRFLLATMTFCLTSGSSSKKSVTLK
jgi:hypothetical protein